VLGLEDFENLEVYPNPTSELLVISGVKGAYDIKLVSLLGKTILSGKNNRELDLSKLKNGIYLLEITTKKGIKQVVRIAKTN